MKNRFNRVLKTGFKTSQATLQTFLLEMFTQRSLKIKQNTVNRHKSSSKKRLSLNPPSLILNRNEPRPPNSTEETIVV
jgi:uncharacterized FlgJ-related protein